jgi:RNase P/RNase MRP subunit p29
MDAGVIPTAVPGVDVSINFRSDPRQIAGIAGRVVKEAMGAG